MAKLIYSGYTCPNKDCPEYGKDNRLMQGLINKEIAIARAPAGTAGNMSDMIYTPSIPGTVKSPGSRASAARVLIDMCTKCGQEYVTEIWEGQLVIPLTINAQPKFE
jgi:hypothetical protein